MFLQLKMRIDVYKTINEASLVVPQDRSGTLQKNQQKNKIQISLE